MEYRQVKQRPSPPPSHAFEEARRHMVTSQLMDRGIQDTQLLKAMGTLPRERFMGTNNPQQAYQDNAMPIACAQTISQPYMVALMTEALQLGPLDKVLEIGTGSGYQTAILAYCAGQIYSVERHKALSDQAQQILQSTLPPHLMAKIHFCVGDGTEGWAEFAPFNAILVTAGATKTVPQPLLDQLSKDHGRIVIPVENQGKSEGQTLLKLVKTENSFQEEDLGRVRFVPLIGTYGWSTHSEKSQ